MNDDTEDAHFNKKNVPAIGSKLELFDTGFYEYLKSLNLIEPNRSFSVEHRNIKLINVLTAQNLPNQVPSFG